MKFHTLLIVGLALGMTGCAEKEQDAPAKPAGTPMAAETEAPDLQSAERAVVGTDAFVRHMHLHAMQFQKLNVALAAEDLAGAQTPAYWLSRHEGVAAPVDKWQPFIEQMREAAEAVTAAPDLGAARAAAKRLGESCIGCHTAAGAPVISLQLDEG
jgi:mono/diheme cytochrome c family protein